jgi:gluconokinase
MSPLLKLLWLKQNEPALFEQAAMFIGIKDYVFYKLFGCYLTDYSMASATGLFNLEKLAYDSKALQLAGIREDQLPQLVPSTHIIEGLDHKRASQLGLSTSTKFVLGAQDGVLANLGIGAVEQGVVAVTIGTSSAVRTRVNKPTLDQEGRLFCYALADDYWMVGGASNNGAIIAQWTADRCYPGQQLDTIVPMLGEIKPGSNGLLFLPLLAGERAPFWDSKAKGLLFGLTLSHTNEQIMHAALEGVLFQVAGIISLMKEAGIAVKEVRASGGFARSSLWCQMMADMLGVPILIPNDVESSSLGAVQLGLYAIEGGSLNRWSQIEGVTYTPNPDKHHAYNKLLPFYMNLYQTLKSQMSELDNLI